MSDKAEASAAENHSQNSGTAKHEEEAPGPLKLDPRGLPLSPQPTDDPKDPLNWNRWLKLMVLAEVSLFSFLALFSASLITPAFVPLSEFLHKDLVTTAYVTSTFILLGGFSSVFWNPIANVYGRRPVYIGTVAVAVAMCGSSGAAKNYGTLIALRCLNGFFGCVPLGLGSATVCDMYFAHERGLYMGVYTISFLTGGHIAPLIGGYIEKNLSWHWCFYVPAIITGGVLVIFIFTVPETLYSRTPAALARPSQSWRSNMLMKRRAHPTRKVRAIDFFRPFQMMMYPSVTIPTWCYSLCFAYGSILFIITSANLFGKIYHFKPQQTGLLLGIPITVGSLIGELFAGGVSDWISERRALRRGGERSPEDRLLGIIPAAFLVPLGIIIEGVCLQNKTHWIGVAFGIAIASFGLQVITTGVYTYTAECYKPQAPELGSLINFGRQVYSFTIGFYAIPFANLIGIEDAWITLAMITFAFFLPLIPLYYKGAEWRKRLGKPTFHQDL
ncbi:MSF permease [Trichoderma guizhouense]|uniref:MSF permease n=1 Tax=Trichoderma guizhouense TaxID=1491466 RepID=A0A1T3CL89_9HYPO|nr:MSF permease [Trichoderma guizhouense]